VNFDALCDYYTLAEVAERWKIKPDSLMLRRAILRGVLKPCLWVPEVEMHRMELNELGRPAHATEAGDPATVRAGGWLYPWYAFHVLTAPFAALFPYMADGPHLDDAAIFAPTTPISLADILNDGVVMAPDLEAAEAETNRRDPSVLSTKEEGTVLRILSATLADCFAYNPTERSDFASHISKAGAKVGIRVSDGSVLKWARRAYNEYPPDYSRPKLVVLCDQPHEPSTELAQLGER
jgi:hypothetical protein